MERICEKCGKPFQTDGAHRKWCSACKEEFFKEKKCLVCGEIFIPTYNKRLTCSRKCAAIYRGNFKNPEILQKIANTNVEKYGAANPFNNPDIQKKCNANNDRVQQKIKMKKICEEKWCEQRHRRQLKTIKGEPPSHKAAILLDYFRHSGLQHLEEVETEKTFPDCVFHSRLRWDFFFKATKEEPYGESANFLLEYDGEQHFRPVRFNSITDSQMYKNFISTQVKDWYKEYYCLKKDLPLLRIPYSTKQEPSAKEICEHIVIVNDYYRHILHTFNIMSEDMVNYHKIAFNIAAGVSCSFKCCKDNPSICQNQPLCNSPIHTVDITEVIKQYQNSLSNAIIFQGLEPLDNLREVLWCIYYFREVTNDDIVLWTGYTEEECKDLIYLIKKMGYKNIIIKYGRFILNAPSRFDEVLGVTLASDNQYAIRYN